MNSVTVNADKNFALTSFVASQLPAESCGLNGLPLTPNSIHVLGNAQLLKSLKHPHLCSYLDFKRGQQDRIVCVSEHYAKSLKDEEPQPGGLVEVAIQVLKALDYLEAQNITVMNLGSESILQQEDKWKLFNYGLGHMTDYGRLVGFPLFNPRTVAPEVLSKGLQNSQLESLGEDANVGGDSISHIMPARDPPFGSSCTVWTLGMLLLAKAMGLRSEDDFWPALQVSQVLRKVLSLATCSDVLLRLCREFEFEVSKLPSELSNLINECLRADPGQRPSPRALLKMLNSPKIVHPIKDSFPTMQLRCERLEIDHEMKEEDLGEFNPLDALDLAEIYYLWVLAGGDVFSELICQGFMVASRPPVLALPKLVLNEGHPVGLQKERCALYNPVVVALSTAQLLSSLSDLNPEDAHPLIMSEMTSNDAQKDNEEMALMPLAIKERDVKYQFRRIVMFRRLLQGYPFTRRNLWNEARVDTLPLYRKYIWAALLGIEHDVQAAYEAIDKDTPTLTDRQIEVDIPRCHQYNTLLASPEGHRKFKRILKAWVATNPQYVYWQGLDSLAAPFLYLNFNDEALAFACLQAFIPKYLLGMFRQDNAAVIQEYLAKFSHLQAFHDPVLFNHLDEIGFIPDLYAIPWVLTMFAHVFPLQSIFHLWDKLLLGNESFPLCVALAILTQLRARLLDAEFNDCILLFSDLPAIDIEECVNDSIRIFCATPKSLTFRQSARQLCKTKLDQDLSQLTLESLTVETQKREKVPRISGEELLMLLGLRPMRDDVDGHFVQHQKPKAVAIDVRPASEYRVGGLPGSVNVPYESAFGPEGQLVAKIDAIEAAKQRKSKVLVVLGSSSNEHARLFAENLVKLQYHRVCVLHTGVEIFRPLGSGILCVQDA